MTTLKTIFILTLVVIVWNSVFGLQRPPPRYSQQYMPQTSFTCRNKIVGSYYADSETDCQLFHVCVSVAGSIQDYRFLCPNDTAFDQESQTCADWYDVDCEAATLYYASDNFDLYRIGSGLESLHYDSIRTDFEPQDHLQRSESNDPIRSPLNSYNSNNYKGLETTKKSNIRADENKHHYMSRNQKQENIDIEKNLQENEESEKKTNLRKIHRKPINNDFMNTYVTKGTNFKSILKQTLYNNKSFSQNFAHLTSLGLSTQAVLTTQKSNQVTSTLRPTTKYINTSARSDNLQDTYTNYQSVKTTFQNNFNNFNRFETTPKSVNMITTQYPESQSYSAQFSQGISLTTKKTILDYHGNNNEQITYNNYDNNYNNKNKSIFNNNNINNYNDLQKTNISYTLSTTSSYNNYNVKSNNNYNSNIYAANIYTPTTYTPPIKKLTNNRQYHNKSTELTTKSTHYTEADSNKVSKKITFQKVYQNYETSTKNYKIERSSFGLGFSPSSVNHLAENFRPTTPTSRRAAFPTTYNPNNFNVNTHAPQTQITQQKSTYYQNPSVKQYSTVTKIFDETTTHNKLTKKNDYDYAYYDNGPMEYDTIELEHVSSNKDSVKII